MDKIKQLLEREIKGSFDFFWETTNWDETSKGYGLSLDTTRKNDVASIASVGFALAAYVIGVERKYITFEQGYERTLKTLHSIYNNIDKYNGFYVHFIHMDTAETRGKDKGRPSEFSTIDTAILHMGTIAVGEYFKGDVADIAETILEEAKWEWLVKDRDTNPVFKMAYQPERFPDNNGFTYASWDHYAEQLMMYFLYAGQDNVDEELAINLYYSFERPLGSYKGENYIHCFNNALFIHQFSHMFLDFDTYHDNKGFSWFLNSRHATLANRQWCLDNPSYETFKQGFWGLTASHSKTGYSVVGGPPWGFKTDQHYPKKIDGTVAPYASLSSILFTEQETLDQLESFGSLDMLWGEYGLYDSFNLDENWCSKSYIGIDKGPTIIMLDNYQNKTILNLVTSSKRMQKAFKILGFHPVKGDS